MCSTKVYLQTIFIFEVFLALVALDSDDEENASVLVRYLASLSALQMVEPTLRPQNPHPVGSQARNQPLLRPHNNDRIST